MKKRILNPLLAFILGAIIFSGITAVSAYTILANNIGYTPSDSSWKKANGEDITNVKDAIDELYDRKAKFVKVGDGKLEFTSGSILPSSKRKMTINNLNSSYLSVNDNSYTVKKEGYYLISYAVGSNTKNESGSGYSAFIQIFVNGVQKVVKQQSYSYYTDGEYLDYLNEGDVITIYTYADGGNVAKKTSFSIYTLDYKD